MTKYVDVYHSMLNKHGIICFFYVNVGGLLITIQWCDMLQHTFVVDLTLTNISLNTIMFFIRFK